MAGFVLEQELRPVEWVAKNYAEDSANKMHSDEVAPLYGFAGGLVPGVGVYAYMTESFADTLGREWHERGSASAKFLKPVYDGERVRVDAKVEAVEPLKVGIEVFNPAGTLCAVGWAGFEDSAPSLDVQDYPERALPEDDERPPASLEALPQGAILGTLEFAFNRQEHESEFLDNVQSTSAIYRGNDAPCHPALYPAQANEILARNVELGPWIHSASEVRHHALPRDGEELSMRGRVAESYLRRGHEYVVLHLALFGEGARPIAWIKHSAVIRPRKVE